MRTRVVSIITWPLRFLRRLLGLLLRPLRKRGKAVEGEQPVNGGEKPAKGKKPGKGEQPATSEKPAKGAKRFRRQKAVKGEKPAKRERSNPFKKLIGLRGKPRIAAIAILAVVVVVLVLSLRPGPNDEKDVRAALDRYAQATREKDYQTLCDDLYARDLVQRIRAAGLPCEVALKTGLQDRQNPQLTVLGVEVSGDQALARARSTAVGEVASVDTIKLIREGGGWRVASLSDPGAAQPGTGP